MALLYHKSRYFIKLPSTVTEISITDMCVVWFAPIIQTIKLYLRSQYWALNWENS